MHVIHNYHTGWQSQYTFILTVKMRQETPEPMEEISRENIYDISDPESDISTPSPKLAPAPKPAPAPAPAPAPKAAPAPALAPSPKAARTLAPASPTPSQEEEDDDEFDDGSEEFSFNRFAILHFQGNASHTHITQRLKEPLLNHDDEGDIVVSEMIFILSPPKSSVLLKLMSISPSHSDPGKSVLLVDYPALHGGHTRAKINRLCISSIQHCQLPQHD